MESMILFGFLLTTSFLLADGGGSGCQDIDHDACISMAKQNSNICSDTILAQTACPKYCNKCPVTCYNCNATTFDASQCNTITCAAGEMCLRSTLSGTGIAHKYKMSCEGAPLCVIFRKRNEHKSRGVSIDNHCCDSDLCNSPLQPTTTVRPTTPSTFVPSTMTTVSQTSPVTYTTQKPYCKRDIIVMMEDSTDLALYYNTMKNSLNHVFKNLDIGPDRTRVAFGTFGVSYATKHWELDRYITKQSLMSAVQSVQPKSHQSNANNLVAVQYVLNHFSQGNRANVPDDVIFITEGHDFKAYSYLQEADAIRRLHQMSQNVIVVALGSVNVYETNSISTDNSHYFYINSIFTFNMNSLVTKITNLVGCS